MRQKGLWLAMGAVLVLGVVFASGAGNHGIRGRETHPAEWVVAASDAPTLLSAADYVCNGSNDTAQIQAALDAANTAGGGTVRLSPGNFTLTEGANSVTDANTDTLTASANQTATMVVTAAEAANFSDGKLVRLSGTNITNLNLDGIYTVSGVSGTTVTLLCPLQTASVDDVDWRILGYSLLLPEMVELVGAGVHATTLKTGQGNFDAIHMEPDSSTGREGFAAIRKLWLHGGNTTPEIGDYNGRRNGIVINAQSYDVRLQDIFPRYFDGDGLVINDGWGLKTVGILVEDCAGHGMVINGPNYSGASRGGSGEINGGKFQACCKAGLRLMYVTDIRVNNAEFGPAASYSGIELLGSNNCTFSGNVIAADVASATAAIRLALADTSVSTHNVITGNHIYATVATAHGVHLDGASYNTISGNVIRSASTTNAGVHFQTTNLSLQNTITGNWIGGVTGSLMDKGIDDNAGYAAECTITGNQITWCTTGLHLDGRDWLATANSFQDCTTPITNGDEGNLVADNAGADLDVQVQGAASGVEHAQYAGGKLTCILTLTAANDFDIADGGDDSNSVKIADLADGKYILLGAYLDVTDSDTTNLSTSYNIAVGITDAAADGASADLSDDDDLIAASTVAAGTSQTKAMNNTTPAVITGSTSAIYLNVGATDANVTGACTIAIQGTLTVLLQRVN